MPPPEDQLTTRQALVFLTSLLGLTAILYLLVVWLVPMWLSR